MDTLKNRNCGLLSPTQSHFAKFKRMFNKLCYAAVKLLPKQLQSLLSQLCKFCQNNISRDGQIIPKTETVAYCRPHNRISLSLKECSTNCVMRRLNCCLSNYNLYYHSCVNFAKTISANYTTVCNWITNQMTSFCIIFASCIFQRAACSTFQTCILNSH